MYWFGRPTVGPTPANIFPKRMEEIIEEPEMTQHCVDRVSKLKYLNKYTVLISYSNTSHELIIYCTHGRLGDSTAYKMLLFH